MAKHSPSPTPIISNQVATGFGASGFQTIEYDFLLVQFIGLNSVNATIKCHGSGSDLEPTWAAAKSASNVFDTKAMYNLSTLGSVLGDTGIVLTGAIATLVREYKINVDMINWINFDVEAWAAGNIYTNVRGLNKQS